MGSHNSAGKSRILPRYKLDDFGLNSEYRDKISEPSRLSSKKASSESEIYPKHWAIVSGGFPPGVTVDEIKKYGRRRQLSHLKPLDNLRLEEGSLKPFKSEYKRRFLAHGLPKVPELPGQNPEEAERREEDLIFPPRSRATFRKPQNNLFLPKDYPMESVTEKNAKYVPFPNCEKRKLLRRSTALRPEGEVASETEVRRQYKKYQNPERAQLIRKLPSLKVEGEFETLTTEQKDKFIAFLLGQRPILEKKKTSLRLEGDFDFLTEKKLNYVPHEFSKRPIIRKRSTSLKLDGEVEFFPEYRNSFVDFPRTRPITYKPNGNIINEGGFEDRTETKTQFVGFGNIPIPETVKPENNLHVEGEMEISPEYKINFVDFPRERPFLRRPLNQLNPEGNLQILTENSEGFCETGGIENPETFQRRTNLTSERDLSFLSENSEKIVKDETPENLEHQKIGPNSKSEGETDSKPEKVEFSYLAPEKGLGRRPSSLKLEGEFPFLSEFTCLDFRKKSLTPIKDVKSNPPSPKKKPKGKTKATFEKEEKSNLTETPRKKSNLKRQSEGSPEKVIQFEVPKNERSGREVPEFKPFPQIQTLPPPDLLRPPKEFSAFKVLDVKGQVGCQSMMKDFLESEKSASDEENPTYRLEVSNAVEKGPGYFDRENGRTAVDSHLLEEAEKRAKQRAENYVKVVKRPQIPNYILGEKSEEKENPWKAAEKLRPLSPEESLNKRAFVVLDEGPVLYNNPPRSPKGAVKRERGDWISDMPSLLPT